MYSPINMINDLCMQKHGLLTTRVERKIAAAQHNVRSMLNIQRPQNQQLDNKESRQKYKIFLKTLNKQMVVAWAGHVARRRNRRWSTATTEWSPQRGKRNRGRQRTRWRDEMDKTNWYADAREKDQWRHHEAFVQLQNALKYKVWNGEKEVLHPIHGDHYVTKDCELTDLLKVIEGSCI